MAGFEAPVEATPQGEQVSTPVESQEQVAPVTEPTSPDQAEQAGEVEAAGDDEGAAERIAEALKDVSPEEFEQLLKHAPPEVREKALFQDLRSAEQRGETRAREELQNRSQMKTAYDEGIAASYQAEQWLQGATNYGAQASQALQQALEFDNTDEAKKHMQALRQSLDPQTVQQATAAIRTGALLEASQIHTAQLNQMILQHGDLFSGDLAFTEDETKGLNKLAYEDGRTGTTRAVHTLIEMMVARAEQRGVSKGRQLGLKDKEVTAKLAERVENIQKARNGAPVSVNGKQPAGKASTDQDRLARLNYQPGAGPPTQEDHVWFNDKYPG